MVLSGYVLDQGNNTGRSRALDGGVQRRLQTSLTPPLGH